MINDDHWWAVPAIVVTAAISAPAYATQYLTLEQAQQVLFPEADAFIASPVTLTPEQQDAVEEYAGVGQRATRQPVWRVQHAGRDAGWFVLDEVYGKHEFITYAVGLDADGQVTGIEILDYRETHGGEVRNAKWRAQFHGAEYGDALKLGREIENISGATLSCKHITEGVRRVLALHAIAIEGRTLP